MPIFNMQSRPQRPSALSGWAGNIGNMLSNVYGIMEQNEANKLAEEAAKKPTGAIVPPEPIDTTPKAGTLPQGLQPFQPFPPITAPSIGGEPIGPKPSPLGGPRRNPMSLEEIMAMFGISPNSTGVIR